MDKYTPSPRIGLNHSLSQSGQVIHSLHSTHRVSILSLIAERFPPQYNLLLVTKKEQVVKRERILALGEGEICGTRYQMVSGFRIR